MSNSNERGRREPAFYRVGGMMCEDFGDAAKHARRIADETAKEMPIWAINRADMETGKLSRLAFVVRPTHVAVFGCTPEQEAATRSALGLPNPREMRYPGERGYVDPKTHAAKLIRDAKKAASVAGKVPLDLAP